MVLPRYVVGLGELPSVEIGVAYVPDFSFLDQFVQLTGDNQQTNNVTKSVPSIVVTLNGANPSGIVGSEKDPATVVGWKLESKTSIVPALKFEAKR